VLIIETSLAVVFAIMVAYVRGSLTDRTIMVICTTAMSISFLVYIIFAVALRLHLGWFRCRAGGELLAQLTNYARCPSCWRSSWASPAASPYRSFFLEEINQARAHRAPRACGEKVMMKHVLRNAMIPSSQRRITCRVFVALPAGGLFSIPGWARDRDAVNRSDFPVIRR